LPPTFAEPSYDKYTTSPPDEQNDSPSTAEYISQYLPHLKTLYPLSEWKFMIGQAMADTDAVDLLFTAQQIQQIHHIANQWPGRESVNGHISKQDALAAYIVTALNQCLKVPVTRMSNMLSVRSLFSPISGMEIECFVSIAASRIQRTWDRTIGELQVPCPSVTPFSKRSPQSFREMNLRLSELSPGTSASQSCSLGTITTSSESSPFRIPSGTDSQRSDPNINSGRVRVH
jgi:hypothetical protein